MIPRPNGVQVGRALISSGRLQSFMAFFYYIYYAENRINNKFTELYD